MTRPRNTRGTLRTRGGMNRSARRCGWVVPATLRETHQFSQYDALTRNVLSGWRSKRSRKSPARDRVPGAESKKFRPCDHTTNSVEPGRYSHRSTTLELNCLELNPLESDPAYGLKRSS